MKKNFGFEFAAFIAVYLIFGILLSKTILYLSLSLVWFAASVIDVCKAIQKVGTENPETLAESILNATSRWNAIRLFRRRFAVVVGTLAEKLVAVPVDEE